MNIASGRLAVVTGAAGGLGGAFAKKLAERGYRLLLVDRRSAELEQVCESLAANQGAVAEPYAVDLCQREEVERLAKRLAQMTDLELLVNNAGFGAVDYFVDTDPSYLVGMVDVHVVAPTILTRAVLPGMIDRNRGGIVNVSSMSSWFYSAGNAQYGSTKNYLAEPTFASRRCVRDLFARNFMRPKACRHLRRDHAPRHTGGCQLMMSPSAHSAAWAANKS